jgi:hypothetical protein
LARDLADVSKSEITGLRESIVSHGVEVTDEGAFMYEKGKVQWNDASVRQEHLREIWVVN